MKQVVPDPVVASRVVESDFKLLPRTGEDVKSVEVLLDQHWKAVGYKADKVVFEIMGLYSNIVKPQLTSNRMPFASCLSFDNRADFYHNTLFLQCFCVRFYRSIHGFYYETLSDRPSV